MTLEHVMPVLVAATSAFLAVPLWEFIRVFVWNRCENQNHKELSEASQRRLKYDIWAFPMCCGNIMSEALIRLLH